MSGHPGTSGRPDGTALRLLFWESTARCNLACIHCRRLDVAEEEARSDLTTEEFRAVLDSTATLGRPIIVFSGGEPLMRPDWEELSTHARDLSLPIALATNGTLVDADVARRIRDVGFHRVSISLDGAEPATHDKFRAVEGAYEQALAGIAELRKLGQSIQINCTIAGHNHDQLDTFYDLASSLGADALHLFLLVPVGCGVEIADSHQLPPERYEQVLEWVCDRQAAGGKMELKATCAPHYYRIAAQRGMAPKHSRGCLGGVSVAFVSHKGEVFPCGYLPVLCGSVREQSFADIWRDSQVFEDLRDYDRLHGKCGACNFRGICGGCRARAYAEAGDYLAAEPACTYEPKGPGTGD